MNFIFLLPWYCRWSYVSPNEQNQVLTIHIFPNPVTFQEKARVYSKLASNFKSESGSYIAWKLWCVIWNMYIGVCEGTIFVSNSVKKGCNLFGPHKLSVPIRYNITEAFTFNYQYTVSLRRRCIQCFVCLCINPGKSSAIKVISTNFYKSRCLI